MVAVPLFSAKINRDIEHFGATHGVKVLDLLPAFEKAYKDGSDPLYHEIEDRHWNAAGHRVAVSKLIEYLNNNRLIPQAHKE